MTREMQLYYEAYNEIFTTEEKIHRHNHPLRGYEEEFIEGPLLELGCGQSELLLEYSRSPRPQVGVDNDAYQLATLREQVDAYAGANAGNTTLHNLTLLRDELPTGVFSVVIMSNILHFFTLSECARLVESLVERTAPGSLLYMVVHSEQFYANQPGKPGNNSYFRHYFKLADLDALFDEARFTRLYAAQITYQQPAKDLLAQRRWVEKQLDLAGITEPESRAYNFDRMLKPHAEDNLTCIYRRK